MTEHLRRFTVSSGLWDEPDNHSGAGGYIYSPQTPGANIDPVLDNRILPSHMPGFTEEELTKLVAILTEGGDIQGAQLYQDLLDELQQGKIVARRKFRQLQAALQKEAVARKYFFDFYLVDELVGVFGQWIPEDVQWYREELVIGIADNYIRNIEQMVWKEAQYLWRHEILYRLVYGKEAGFSQPSLLPDEQIVNQAIERERMKMRHMQEVERSRYKRKGLPVPPELQDSPPPGPYELEHNPELQKDTEDEDDPLATFEELLQTDPAKAKELLKKLKFDAASGVKSIFSEKGLRQFVKLAQVFNQSSLLTEAKKILQSQLLPTLVLNDHLEQGQDTIHGEPTYNLDDASSAIETIAMLLGRIHEKLGADETTTVEELQAEPIVRRIYNMCYSIFYDNRVATPLSFNLMTFLQDFPLAVVENAADNLEEVNEAGIELGVPFLSDEEVVTLKERLDQLANTFSQKMYSQIDGYNFHGWCAEFMLALRPIVHAIGFVDLKMVPPKLCEYIAEQIHGDFSKCLHGPTSNRELANILVQWLVNDPIYVDTSIHKDPLYQRYTAIAENTTEIQQYILQIIDAELEIQSLPSLYGDLLAIEAIPTVWCDIKNTPEEGKAAVTSSILSTFFSILDYMYTSLNVPVSNSIAEYIKDDHGLTDLQNVVTSELDKQATFSSVEGWLLECFEVIHENCVLSVEDVCALPAAEIILLEAMPTDLRGSFGIFAFSSILQKTGTDFLAEHVPGETDRERIEERLERARQERRQNGKYNGEDPYVLMSKRHEGYNTHGNVKIPAGVNRIKEVLTLLDIDPDLGWTVIEALRFPYGQVRAGAELEDNHLPTSYFRMINELYDKLPWNTSYGGPAWGMICKGLVDLMEAYPDVDRLTHAIDNVHDLQHNTGSVFTKFKHSYYVYEDENGNPLPEDAEPRKIVEYSNESEWIQEALDIKFGKTGTRDMLPMCSPKVAKWVRKAYMDAGRSSMINPPTEEDKLDELASQVEILYSAGDKKAIHARIRDSKDSMFYHALAAHQPRDEMEVQLLADTHNYLIKKFLWDELQTPLRSDTKQILNLGQFQVTLPGYITKHMFVGEVWNSLTADKQKKATQYFEQYFPGDFTQLTKYASSMGASVGSQPEADQQTWLFNGYIYAAYFAIDENVKEVLSLPTAEEKADIKTVAQALSEKQLEYIDSLNQKALKLQEDAKQSIAKSAQEATEPQTLYDPPSGEINGAALIKMIQSVIDGYTSIMATPYDVAKKMINELQVQINHENTGVIFSSRDAFDGFIASSGTIIELLQQFNKVSLLQIGKMVKPLLEDISTEPKPGTVIAGQTYVDTIRHLYRAINAILDTKPEVQKNVCDFARKADKIVGTWQFIQNSTDKPTKAKIYDVITDEVENSMTPELKAFLGGDYQTSTLVDICDSFVEWHSDVAKALVVEDSTSFTYSSNEAFHHIWLAVAKIDLDKWPHYALPNFEVFLNVFQQALDAGAIYIMSGGEDPNLEDEEHSETASQSIDEEPQESNAGIALRNILIWYQLLKKAGPEKLENWLGDVGKTLQESDLIKLDIDKPLLIKMLEDSFANLFIIAKSYMVGGGSLSNQNEFMIAICQTHTGSIMWDQLLSDYFIEQQGDEVDESEIFKDFFISAADVMSLSISKGMYDSEFANSLLMQHVNMISDYPDAVKTLFDDATEAWDKVPKNKQTAIVEQISKRLAKDLAFDALTAGEYITVLQQMATASSAEVAFGKNPIPKNVIIALLLLTYEYASGVKETSSTAEEEYENIVGKDITEYFTPRLEAVGVEAGDHFWWAKDTIQNFWTHPKTTLDQRIALIEPAIEIAAKAGVLKKGITATVFLKHFKAYIQQVSGYQGTSLVSPEAANRGYIDNELIAALMVDIYKQVPDGFNPGSTQEEQNAFFKKKQVTPKEPQPDISPLDEAMKKVIDKQKSEKNPSYDIKQLKYEGPSEKTKQEYDLEQTTPLPKGDPSQPKKQQPKKKNKSKGKNPPKQWFTPKDDPDDPDDPDNPALDAQLNGLRTFSTI